jgi:hypothetical protein
MVDRSKTVTDRPSLRAYAAEQTPLMPAPMTATDATPEGGDCGGEAMAGEEAKTKKGYLWWYKVRGWTGHCDGLAASPGYMYSNRLPATARCTTMLINPQRASCDAGRDTTPPWAFVGGVVGGVAEGVIALEPEAPTVFRGARNPWRDGDTRLSARGGGFQEASRTTPRHVGSERGDQPAPCMRALLTVGLVMVVVWVWSADPGGRHHTCLSSRGVLLCMDEERVGLWESTV